MKMSDFKQADFDNLPCDLFEEGKYAFIEFDNLGRPNCPICADMAETIILLLSMGISPVQGAYVKYARLKELKK